MKKYYKALLFGSIGTLVETSEIQRKSFNEAFKKNGLDWYWTKKEYIKLLNKSGGRDRITEYARTKGIKVNACLLYTSPSPRDVEESRMPSSA